LSPILFSASIMDLTPEEQRILAGEAGEAARIAMAVLVDLGAVFGAERLIPVAQVHIDTTLYIDKKRLS